MRLQKYMAKCGIASRRKSEKIILDNRVKVNNKIINELGYKVDINKDTVSVDDKKIFLEEEKVYILLNKPTGYVTTVSDQFNRPTVIDLIEGVNQRIYPVGRLDYDTSGLLILTNDGDLTYKLTHPKHEVNKTYVSKVKGVPTQEEINRFENGLIIDGYKTSKASIKILRKFNNKSLVEIKIHEGRNRQVRKMCKEIGHPVVTLKRVAIGTIELGNLEVGKWRKLTEKEVDYLKKKKTL
ncbi:pseudouridine synthase [Dethiothermospora halolimnae]|uniref:pseudouridine synthase n=1 Tax=Dethiothermospora halolimnae TaxID=3114390 RepID=UPI003CCBCFDA